MVDCFVTAPATNGLPYGAEILGDDEYGGEGGIARKLADAHRISATIELLAVAERLALATNEGDDASQGTHYVDSAGRIRCKGSFLALIEDARAAIAKSTGSSE